MYIISFFTFFWPHLVACGILVPWLGIEPVPPALGAQNLNHWATREVPQWIWLNVILIWKIESVYVIEHSPVDDFNMDLPHWCPEGYCRGSQRWLPWAATKWPMLGWILYCCHLEILSSLWTRDPMFPFLTEPANYVASLRHQKWSFSKARGQPTPPTQKEVWILWWSWNLVNSSPPSKTSSLLIDKFHIPPSALDLLRSFLPFR